MAYGAGLGQPSIMGNKDMAFVYYYRGVDISNYVGLIQ